MRYREALLLAGAVVAAVLGFELLTIAFRPLEDAVRFAPVFIFILVGVTVLILVRALRGPSGGAGRAR
ncbi:MAG: hypothetical protein H0V12_10145 [Chloroflexi bacterium]|nr:hypothetical protein [Chloroflexota bacterium]